MKVFRTLCRWAAAAVLVYAGIAKTVDPEATRKALAFAFESIGAQPLAAFVAVLVGAEVYLGTMLIVSSEARWPTITAAVLTGLLSLGLATLRGAGFTADCGCATPLDVFFQRGDELARNGVLIAMLVVSIPPRESALGPDPAGSAC